MSKTSTCARGSSSTRSRGVASARSPPLRTRAKPAIQFAWRQPLLNVQRPETRKPPSTSTASPREAGRFRSHCAGRRPRSRRPDVLRVPTEPALLAARGTRAVSGATAGGELHDPHRAPGNRLRVYGRHFVAEPGPVGQRDRFAHHQQPLPLDHRARTRVLRRPGPVLSSRGSTPPDLDNHGPGTEAAGSGRDQITPRPLPVYSKLHDCGRDPQEARRTTT